MKLFGKVERALFISRPNRFIVECELKGRRLKAYLPNPGRLWELFLPGSTICLVPKTSASSKYEYICVAVEKNGVPVLLHTHLNNSVARYLIEHNRVPGLEGAEVIRPEVPFGRSRFDFLLQHNGKQVVLEVKSCTLFNGKMAMFPDAVTDRGRRHLEELASLSESDRNCAVLFIVHAPGVRYFLPEYHTDLAFSKTLLEVSRKVMVKSLSVSWTEGLSLRKRIDDLVIPWDLVKKEARDSGSYITVLRLTKGRDISVGSLGNVRFKKGYYAYVGSAQRNLSKRMARHQRKRKNLFWHIDYLRQEADYVASFPVRSSKDLECDISSALQEISHWHIPCFGSSDCGCETHLVGLDGDPLSSPQFIKLLLFFRMDRLGDFLK